VGDGQTTASALGAGAVLDNGTLVFAIPATANISLNSVISGNGSLSLQGGGLLTLSASNSYTGATTISAGTLQLGSGGSTGSLYGAGAMTDNGTLVFNRGNAVLQGTNFSGLITGSGAVVQRVAAHCTCTVRTPSGGTVISSGIISWAITTATTRSLPHWVQGRSRSAATANCSLAASLAHSQLHDSQ